MKSIQFISCTAIVTLLLCQFSLYGQWGSKDHVISLGVGYGFRMPFTKADNNYYHESLEFSPGSDGLRLIATSAPASYRTGGYGNGLEFFLTYNIPLSSNFALSAGIQHFRSLKDTYVWHELGDVVHAIGMPSHLFYTRTDEAFYSTLLVGAQHNNEISRTLAFFFQSDILIGLAKRKSTFSYDQPLPSGESLQDESDHSFGIGIQSKAGLKFQTSKSTNFLVGLKSAVFQAQISEGKLTYYENGNPVAERDYSFGDESALGSARSNVDDAQGLKQNIPFNNIGLFIQIDFRI